jgi:hypothetical protein
MGRTAVVGIRSEGNNYDDSSRSISSALGFGIESSRAFSAAAFRVLPKYVFMPSAANAEHFWLGGAAG